MNIKKLSILGIFLFSGIFINNNAKADCDSTCVGNVPLYNQPLQHTYTRQLPFNYNPANVTYNYMTSACPAGYRGTDGGAGYIHERQTVLTYPNGAVTVGEWTVYDDNCVEIPPTPPGLDGATLPFTQTYSFNEICGISYSLYRSSNFGCSAANITITVTYTSFQVVGGVRYYSGRYTSNRPRANYSFGDYSSCPSNSNPTSVFLDGITSDSKFLLNFQSNASNDADAIYKTDHDAVWQGFILRPPGSYPEIRSNRLIETTLCTEHIGA